MKSRALTGVTFIAFWVVAAFFGFIHIHGGGWPQGGAPLSSETEGRVLVATGLQESWQFFEKDLRAEQIFVMKKDGDAWTTVGPVANGEPENLLGVSRRPRKDAVERNRLVAYVRNDGWARCGDDLDACIDGARAPISINNPAPRPAYCGSFVLVKKAPVSWAYANVPKPPQTVLAARVEIKC
jgi:antimicrobial peptide system SdpA family protein